MRVSWRFACCRHRENAQDVLQPLVSDRSPVVRAAAVYALGRYLGHTERTERSMTVENGVAMALLIATADCAPMVRREVRSADA